MPDEEDPGVDHRRRAGEVINIIGMAIRKRDSRSELETLQMAAHPGLTPPPTKYPQLAAAMRAQPGD